MSTIAKRRVINDGRDPSPVEIPGGMGCPKCARPMQRYEHSPTWKPKPGYGFYRYWDRCLPCKLLSNPPEAYVKGDKGLRK